MNEQEKLEESNQICQTIMAILEKYTVDRGTQLANEASPTAQAIAAQLFQSVMAQLRRDQSGTILADAYQADPSAYASPIAHLLNHALLNNTNFKQSLQILLKQYQVATQTTTRISSSKTTINSGGAIAQGDGAIAVGQGGVFVQGNITGHIITGNQNVINDKAASHIPSPLPPPLAQLRQQLTRHFDKEEIKTLCYDLHIPYNDLSSQGHASKVRELLHYCQRANLVDQLMAECHRLRPHVNWHTTE